MTTVFTKAIVIACLLGPMVVHAENKNQTFYAGSSSSDVFNFSIIEPSNVTLDYAWSDMALMKNDSLREYDASLLSWILNGPTRQSGGFIDGPASTGSGTLSLTGLMPGAYTLTFNGIWDDVTLFGMGNSDLTRTPGHVGWFDGDLLGGQPEFNSFTVTPVAASVVSEPASYTLVLAGLGLMGFITRRRKSDQALD